MWRSPVAPMHNNPVRTAFGCLVCLVLACAVPCRATDGPKVGLLMKDRTPFWRSVEAGAAAEVRQAGGTLVAKAPSVSSNTGQQLALLDLLAEEENLAALLVGPLSVEDFRRPLAALASRGVKVVVIDTPPTEEPLGHVAIGYDQAEMARAAARAFAALAGPTDEYALLHIVSYDVTVVREREFLGELRRVRPEAVVRADRDSTERIHDDYLQCCKLLDNHPNARAVATLYTGSSLDMMRALKTKGRAGAVKHLGFGVGLPAEVAEAIEADQLHAWVAQLPDEIGRAAAKAALDLLAGVRVPKPIAPEYFIVTRQNISDRRIRRLREE